MKRKDCSQLDSTCPAPRQVRHEADDDGDGGQRGVRLGRGVAAQVEFESPNFEKPGYHISGYQGLGHQALSGYGCQLVQPHHGAHVRRQPGGGLGERAGGASEAHVDVQLLHLIRQLGLALVTQVISQWSKHGSIDASQVLYPARSCNQPGPGNHPDTRE
jgi:hypothetical protein